MIKIDYDKIKENTGLDFTKNGKYKEQDLLFYIDSIVYNLKINNKNYTKEQYDRITTLFDILDSMEVR